MIEHTPDPWKTPEQQREDRDKLTQVLDLSLYDHVFHHVDFGEDPYEDPNIPEDKVGLAQQARKVLRSHEEANTISSALLEDVKYTTAPAGPGSAAAVRAEKAVREPTGTHTIALDIDHRVRVVPSSTPGNSHLYIDVELEWEQYEKLLDVLGEIGVVQPGYVAASKRRKATHLRLPWVKKEPEPEKPGEEPEF